MSVDRAALDWFRDHHATVSNTADLLTVDERRRLVTTGVLTRVVRGAYALAGFEEDELTRCAALCAGRSGLVVAGPTAARLWNLRRAPSDGLVQVISPPRSNPCSAPWVRPYRTPTLPDFDIVARPDGIRLTSPPRTVVDMARHLGESDLASMIEDVLARGMCIEATLARTAHRLEARGRPWVRRFLAVLGARAPGAPAESEWERRVFDALVGRGVAGLERQWPVQLPGYGPARFDIAVPVAWWALEIDVHPEHRTVDGAARDNRRDDAAEAAGWAVRRLAEAQLTQEFGATIDSVIAAIARRCRQLDSSTRCGE
jgi:very-short-patch-repair endonuclease